MSLSYVSILLGDLSFKQLCLSLHQRTASRLKAEFIRVEMWGVPDYQEKEGGSLRKEWEERRKNLVGKLPLETLFPKRVSKPPQKL
jgi:hypothetical protein